MSAPRDELVLVAEEGQQRAAQVRRRVERLHGLEPAVEPVGRVQDAVLVREQAIERHGGGEPAALARREQRVHAAHAEAHHAGAARARRLREREEIDRGLDVAQHLGIGERRASTRRGS